jgi:hypothetical protein
MAICIRSGSISTRRQIVESCANRSWCADGELCFLLTGMLPGNENAMDDEKRDEKHDAAPSRHQV